MPNITVNLSSTTGRTLSKYVFGFATGALGDNSFLFAANATAKTSMAVIRPTLLRVNSQLQTIEQWASGNTGVMNNFWNNASSFMDATYRLVMGCGPTFNDTSVSPSTRATNTANFASAMRSQGHEIFYWEVGNECQGMGVSAYNGYFNAIYDALKGVNSSYIIGGPTADWWNDIDLNSWANGIGGRAPGFCSIHSYPVGPSTSTAQCYINMSGFTDVDSTRSSLEGHGNTAGIPIGLLEYNMDGNPGEDTRQGTYIGAVHVALQLVRAFQGTGTNVPNFQMGGLWDIIQDSNYGSVGNSSSGGNNAVIDPQGYYLGKAGQVMAGTEVSVSGISGNLQVLATKSGTNVAIHLVNYDTASASANNITLTGGQPSGTITRWEIGKSNQSTPNVTTQASLSSVNVPSEQIVILTFSTAVVQPGIISVNTPSGVLPNASFTSSGTLSNYSSAPVLSYKDDGGTTTGFPTGSTVSTTSFSFLHPGVTSGAHNLSVTDGTVTSATVSYTVPANSIAINVISNPLPNTTFTVSGSLANYSVAPTLTYSDDGLAAKALPTGSTVTTTSFSFVHPGMQAGAHTLAVLSGSISGSASYTAIDTAWRSNVGVASPSTVTGLAPSVSYDFRVFATNVVGDGPVSAILTQVTSAAAIIIPTAPTALASNAVSSASITVSWTGPTIGTPPFSYLIQSAPAGSGSWVNGPTVTVLSAQVTGLSASTSYDFRVFASNTAGSSPASATFTTSTSAAPVTVTWQLSSKSAAIALSNASLTATATGSSTAYSTYQSCFSTTSISSGKSSFEVTFTQLTQNASVGLANASYVVGTGGPATAQATTFYPSTGTGSQPPQSAYFNSIATLTPPGTPTADSPGATLTFCVDATARLWWVTGPAMRATYGSAAWNDSATANPATGAGGLPISVTGNLFILFDTEEGGAVAVLNAGSSSFSISVPSTFPAWNGQSTTTIIPGQVTGLTTGTPASTSMPLTWTDPPTGTQPFTYTVQSSIHGTGNWTTFGSTLLFADEFAVNSTSDNGGAGTGSAQIILSGSGGSITDSSGNIWTISTSNTVLENGAAAGFTANVTEVAYVNGTIWHENTSNQWYSWSPPSTWNAGSDPTGGTTLGTWMNHYPFGGNEFTLPFNNEAEYYASSSRTLGFTPFSVAGSNLNITADTIAHTVSNPLGLPYNSGVIVSCIESNGTPASGLFSRIYGYYEAQCQLPKGRGLWPAFWLLPLTGAGEIDIFEQLGQDTTTIFCSLHATVGGGSVTVPLGFDASTSMHAYGCSWQPDFITMYVDRIQVAQFVTPSDMIGKPYYILLNLAVGALNSFPGPPDGTTPFPSHMLVGYVHVYDTRPF